jgi:hypothetical protein
LKLGAKILYLRILSKTGVLHSIYRTEQREYFYSWGFTPGNEPSSFQDFIEGMIFPTVPEGRKPFTHFLVIEKVRYKGRGNFALVSIPKSK